MRAFRNIYPSDRRLHKVDVPKPQAEGLKVLVKVLAAGVCHSDIMILDPASPYSNTSFTLGHESAGQIEDITPEAEKAFPALKKGTVVAIFGANSCQKATCKHCSSGRQVLCPNSLPYGAGIDGGYADYILVDAQSLVKAPDALASKPEVVAVTTDAVLTPYHALTRSQAFEEMKANFKYHIAVIGLGGLGTNIIQILQYKLKQANLRSNVTITGIDLKQSALDVAKSFNVADKYLLIDDAPEQLAKENIQFDYVFDCCGAVQTYKLSQDTVSRGGKIVLVGLYDGELTHYSHVGMGKETTVCQTYWGDIHELAECLDLVAKGVIVPKISTRSLEEINDVLQDFDDHKIVGRVVVIP